MNIQIMENMHYKFVRELERPTTYMHNDKLSAVIILDSNKQFHSKLILKNQESTERINYKL